MDSPVSLTDDDFDADLYEDDTPEGYLSEAAKGRYITLVATVAVAYFLLQMFLPQIIMYSMNPQMLPGRMKIENLQLARTVRYGDQYVVPVMQLAMATPSYVLRFVGEDGKWVKEGDVRVPEDVQSLVVDGTSIWIVSAGSVSHWGDEQLTTIYPSTPLTPAAHAFLHAGRLRVVDVGPSGYWRCLDYIDGQWVIAGWLIMPETASPNFPGTTVPMVMPRSDQLRVVLQGDTPMLVYSDGKALWRASGLPLTDVDPGQTAAGAVSALHPANADLWSKCSLAWLPQLPWQVAAGEDGLLIATASRGGNINYQVALSRWTLAGTVETVATSSGMFLEKLQLLADEQHGVTLLVDSFPPGGMRTFQLVGSEFQEGNALGNNVLFPMFGENFWQMYLILMAVSMTLPLAFLITMHYLMLKHRQPRYAFGHGQVRLASLGRRAVARTLDGLLFSLPYIPVWIWVFQTYDLEKLFQQFTADLIGSLKTILIVVAAALAYGLIYIILMGVMQGVWGCTPGKWLCRLRVIRTNFQPVGVLRGIARELLMLVDTQFNYLVGVLMIALLVKCQRLGDLVADSIVVEAASVPQRHVEAAT